MEGYVYTVTENPWIGWTHNTTQPLEIATADGMKEYEGYTIEVNN